MTWWSGLAGLRNLTQWGWTTRADTTWNSERQSKNSLQIITNYYNMTLDMISARRVALCVASLLWLLSASLVFILFSSTSWTTVGPLHSLSGARTSRFCRRRSAHQRPSAQRRRAHWGCPKHRPAPRRRSLRSLERLMSCVAWMPVMCLQNSTNIHVLVFLQTGSRRVSARNKNEKKKEALHCWITTESLLSETAPETYGSTNPAPKGYNHYLHHS